VAADTSFPPLAERPGRRIGLAGLALAVLLAAAWPEPALASGHDEGERVEVTGLVTDAAGRPLSGLQVTLIATRQTFSIRSFHREIRDTARVTTRSNERGEYSLSWLWAGYYNHFVLEAAVAVRTGQGERLSLLTSQDVTGRIRRSPVVAALVVADTSFLDAYRAFVAALDTESERRVFQTMGKPDRIESKTAADHDETTWWYFDAGKSFVFDHGNLVREVPFEPVKPFADPSSGS
jgi:hypothetical protein